MSLNLKCSCLETCCLFVSLKFELRVVGNLLFVYGAKFELCVVGNLLFVCGAKFELRKVENILFVYGTKFELRKVENIFSIPLNLNYVKLTIFDFFARRFGISGSVT